MSAVALGSPVLQSCKQLRCVWHHAHKTNAHVKIGFEKHMLCSTRACVTGQRYGRPNAAIIYRAYICIALVQANWDVTRQFVLSNSKQPRPQQRRDAMARCWSTHQSGLSKACRPKLGRVITSRAPVTSSRREAVPYSNHPDTTEKYKWPGDALQGARR